MAKTSTATKPGWRLIHDGVRVITLFEAGSENTQSVHTIFVAATEAACQAEITRLGLQPLSADGIEVFSA